MVRKEHINGLHWWAGPRLHGRDCPSVVVGVTPISGLATATDGRYERIDPSAWDDVWIVGDVHGCEDALRRLLDAVEFGPADLAVVVGDLVRKGPDSATVTQFVRDRENVRSVMGNNERKLARGDASLPSLSAADREFLTSLPVGIQLGDAIVVHGGVDHRKSLSDHSIDELLTTRSLVPGASYDRPYWFERRTEGPRVFFGHTVMAEPFVSPWAVGLDTGCVYGGRLSAMHLGTGRIEQVSPATTHQSRSADSIVEPRPPRADSSR